MINFETDKKPMTFLLDQIAQGELALPDFQRDFVWEPNATRELVASVIQSFPAGTLLLMQGGAKMFAPRAVSGAKDLGASTPAYLVLDGQQRLTSLYQAFNGVGSHRFFLNVQELLDGEEVDEATDVFPQRRAKRWDSVDNQAADLMLPLHRLRKFGEWKDEVLDRRPEQGQDRRDLRARLNAINDEHIKAAEAYMFPVTTLAQSTPIEAVCTIFETLNRTGVKLSVFELLTARAFAGEVRLRDMWEDACDDHPVLSEFGVDPYYVLQAISLRVTGSAKRGSVLKLRVDDIVDEWEQVTSGMAHGLLLLRDECGVLVEKWLPYKTMIVTLAATWPAVAEMKGPKIGEARAKLRRWFWCSTFSGTYDSASNTRAELDHARLTEWLGGGEVPGVVGAFAFDPQLWRSVTPRQRAMYQSTIALCMSGAPRDFHDGTPLTGQIIAGRAVDDHHIFPRAWLKQQQLEAEPDSVLNHTLIGKATNIRIGGRAPSTYLDEMAASLKDDLEPILESHLLPSGADGPLRTDDYDGFLAWRIDRLAQRLQSLTG